MVWERYGPGHAPHLVTEDQMVTTNKHTITFTTEQLNAMHKLLHWHNANFKSRPAGEELQGKTEILKQAEGIIEYSLTNPDFKF